MKFPPVFTITEQASRLLRELDVLREASAYIPRPEGVSALIRQESILKSSLFSARIEGNPLTMSEARVQFGSGNPDVHLREVENLNRAFGWLGQHHADMITVDFLRRLHGIVLEGVSADAGHIRSEDSAIFNQAGVAVYLPPAPMQIGALIQELCHWVDVAGDPPPVVASVAHIWFEKIHPFLDGNGRVGRMLSHCILLKGGYEIAGVIPFEEYLDTNRQEYYDALSTDSADVSAFVEFFLGALVSQSRRSMEALKQPRDMKAAGLLPRRAEILALVRDHTTVSFDFLRRRFRAVPERTLHYDLAQMIKRGHLKKMGSTRGALYTLA